MDYSRNYFCFSVFILFVITNVCSGASLLNMQDVANTEQQEGEIVDKTDSLMPSSVMTQEVSSAVSSTRTAEGDIIITTSAEAIGSQSISPEETPNPPPSSLPEDQERESSVPSETNPELTSTLEIGDETSATNTETKSDDESSETVAASTESSNPEEPDTGKPESTSSSTLPNGASTLSLPNAFGLLLIAFVSRALFPKT